MEDWEYRVLYSYGKQGQELASSALEFLLDVNDDFRRAQMKLTGVQYQELVDRLGVKLEMVLAGVGRI